MVYLSIAWWIFPWRTVSLPEYILLSSPYSPMLSHCNKPLNITINIAMLVITRWCWWNPLCWWVGGGRFVSTQFEGEHFQGPTVNLPEDCQKINQWSYESQDISHHKISPITRYLPLLTNMLTKDSPMKILSKNASFQREDNTQSARWQAAMQRSLQRPPINVATDNGGFHSHGATPRATPIAGGFVMENPSLKWDDCISLFWDDLVTITGKLLGICWVYPHCH